jgi:hypothetical protein
MIKRVIQAALAVSALLIVLVVTGPTGAQGVQKTAICHATGSASNPFSFLELPPEPLDDHFDGNGNPLEGHENDRLASDSEIEAKECNGSVGPPPTPDPGAVPEPITILLFGAGVAGVGYASRRIRRNRESKGSGE